jgi:alkylation response protein AidB-like acyl-CoA dehydrogenase
MESSRLSPPLGDLPLDLRYTAAEQAFRADVHARLRDAVPAALRHKVRMGVPLDKTDQVQAHRILHRLGWAVPHWPIDWGGQALTAVQRYILLEEIHAACVPPPLAANVSMIGPVLVAFGSQQQKERFLPRIANLDDWWCQGFSEPNAGSDLASLRTTATRSDGHYVVNGQKIWSTQAQHADWMFALVRTDLQAKPQRGISFLLIDMRSPGITQRPIRLVGGEPEVNEVFFDDVRVPIENLVGAENHGWDYAKYLLSHERTGIAGVGIVKELLARIRDFARQRRRAGGTRRDDAALRVRVAEIEVELSALEITQLRAAASQRLDTSIDVTASLLKIKGSELQQRASELLMDLAGPAGTVAPDGSSDGWEHRAAGLYLNGRKVSIYGGSNEIQRNIVAKMLLGN